MPRSAPPEDEAQGTVPAPSIGILVRRLRVGVRSGVNELNAKIESYRPGGRVLDKYRRSVAEFSNYRKRRIARRQQQPGV
jgi:Ni/Co efflux regulator RcnB